MPIFEGGGGGSATINVPTGHIKYDYDGGTRLVYEGHNDTGVLLSSMTWTIYDSNRLIEKLVAVDSWDNRGSANYSGEPTEQLVFDGEKVTFDGEDIVF